MINYCYYCQSREVILTDMTGYNFDKKCIKLAMINIQEEITYRQMQSKMVLQIHDELLFEFPKEEEDILIPVVVNSMEKAMQLKVPIIVDYGSGSNWYEAH